MGSGHRCDIDGGGTVGVRRGCSAAPGGKKLALSQFKSVFAKQIKGGICSPAGVPPHLHVNALARAQRAPACQGGGCGARQRERGGASALTQLTRSVKGRIITPPECGLIISSSLLLPTTILATAWRGSVAGWTRRGASTARFAARDFPTPHPVALTDAGKGRAEVRHETNGRARSLCEHEREGGHGEAGAPPTGPGVGYSPLWVSRGTARRPGFRPRADPPATHPRVISNG